MSIFSKRNLENTICMACGLPFIKHTKDRATKFSAKALMKCMMRVQASYALDMGKLKMEKKNESG